jgi:hypothetical protein
MNGMFMRATLRSYKEDSWSNQDSSLRESVKKRDGSKGAAIQRGLEHPLLEAITREWVVKTQQTGKDLLFTVSL